MRRKVRKTFFVSSEKFLINFSIGCRIFGLPKPLYRYVYQRETASHNRLLKWRKRQIRKPKYYCLHPWTAVSLASVYDKRSLVLSGSFFCSFRHWLTGQCNFLFKSYVICLKIDVRHELRPPAGTEWNRCLSVSLLLHAALFDQLFRLLAVIKVFH